MDATEPAHGGAILHRDVPGERRAVDHDDVIAHHAVVGHVAGGHQEAMRTHHGVVALVGGAVDGRVLADHGVLADANPGDGVLAILEVLGLGADDGAVAHAAAGPEPDAPLEDGVGADHHAVAHLDLGPDEGAGAHAHVRAQSRLGIHEGRGMNVGHGFARFSSSPSRASSSRTRRSRSGSRPCAAQIRLVSPVGRAGMPLQTSPAGISPVKPDFAVMMAPARCLRDRPRRPDRRAPAIADPA